MTMGNNMEEKTLKIQLPYDPANPFQGIYPKEIKLLSLGDIHTPMFIIHSHQDMETTKMSVDR